MKKTDFETFKISLNLSIDIDNELRRINELIRLASNMRNIDALRALHGMLESCECSISEYINNNLTDDVE